MAKKDHWAAAARYIGDVVNGQTLACKWVQLACERTIRDLERQRTAAFPYRFDATRANKVCAFVECLPHVKGSKWAGDCVPPTGRESRSDQRSGHLVFAVAARRRGVVELDLLAWLQVLDHARLEGFHGSLGDRVGAGDVQRVALDAFRLLHEGGDARLHFFAHALRVAVVKPVSVGLCTVGYDKVCERLISDRHVRGPVCYPTASTCA